MNCFNHENISAVGLCKCCGKGLCKDCLTDLGQGLACKGSHEDQVSSIIMMNEKAGKAYESAPKNILIAPVFFFFMGVVFVSTELFSGDELSSFPLFMGAGFICFSIITYIRNRAIFSNDRKS